MFSSTIPKFLCSRREGRRRSSGPFDQSALEMGNNVLVYTSEPVKREMEVFGQPRIKLYAATSAAHADFTAKLVRVTLGGRAEFVCIGIARSSWLFRETGYAGGYGPTVGVHARAHGIRARSGRTAAT